MVECAWFWGTGTYSSSSGLSTCREMASTLCSVVKRWNRVVLMFHLFNALNIHAPDCQVKLGWSNKAVFYFSPSPVPERAGRSGGGAAGREVLPPGPVCDAPCR